MFLIRNMTHYRGSISTHRYPGSGWNFWGHILFIGNIAHSSSSISTHGYSGSGWYHRFRILIVRHITRCSGSVSIPLIDIVDLSPDFYIILKNRRYSAYWLRR